MTEQEKYEWIARCLDGEASQEELLELERRAADDLEFRELLALHREMKESFQDEGAMRLSAAIQAAEQSYHASQEQQNGQERSQKKRFNWKIISIAASVVLLLGIGFLIYLNMNRHLSPAEAFDNFYEQYEAPANFRSEESTLKANYEAAFRSYNQGDFAAAAQGFAAIHADDPAQNTATFYLGMSLMGQGKAAEAQVQFKALADQPNTYQKQSQWYLALSYLKLGDKESALPLLQSLSQGKGSYQAKASELLESL